MDEPFQLVSLFCLFIYWAEKKKGGKFERAWKIDGKIDLSGSVRMGVSDAALVVIKNGRKGSVLKITHCKLRSVFDQQKAAYAVASLVTSCE